MASSCDACRVERDGRSSSEAFVLGLMVADLQWRNRRRREGTLCDKHGTFPHSEPVMLTTHKDKMHQAQIQLEKLKAVKHIITHKDCADGLASALIIKGVLPDADVQFLQYNTHEHLHLQPQPGMLFCDFSPAPETVERFVEAGAIVLDHHRTQKDVVLKFGDNGVYADEKDNPGVSGATLAYVEVFLPFSNAEYGIGELKTAVGRMIENHRSVAKFAHLAAIRDTWQKSAPDWDDACTQAHGLRFYSPDTLLALGYRFFDFKWQSQIYDVGQQVVAQRRIQHTEMIASAYSFETAEGLRVAVVPTADVSDVADMIGSDADLVIGFKYRWDAKQGPFGVGKIILSTRSRGAFDCSALCKRFGGGGHTQAAGCTIDLKEATLQPYALIEGIIKVNEDIDKLEEPNGVTPG